MLILSLREQSSQNQSQYEQQHQYNAEPGAPTASSRESRRKVLRFNKTFMLVSGSSALRGTDGDIFPTSHFSQLPTQDGLVGDSSEDAPKGLEMQRCTTPPQTLSTPRQQEQRAEQRGQNEAESEPPAVNSRGLKPALRPVRGPPEVHPPVPLQSHVANTEGTQVNQTTEDRDDTTTEAKMELAVCVLKDTAEPNLHLVSKLR